MVDLMYVRVQFLRHFLPCGPTSLLRCSILAPDLLGFISTPGPVNQNLPIKMHPICCEVTSEKSDSAIVVSR